MIRAARPADMPRIRGIEVAAGELFREIGMDTRAWVAANPTDAAGNPIAYLVVDVIDNCAHIEQVTVHPAYSRKVSAVHSSTTWNDGPPHTTLME